MPSRGRKQILESYIRGKKLKHSRQRVQILDTLIKSERHLTADELYREVKVVLPTIGCATVYRALKVFCESGICRDLRLEDGATRYELVRGDEHHDHLVCIECGRFQEVVDPKIEKLQEKLARTEGFTLKRHRLEMYGICRKCRKRR
jgi:Fur family ferric uptake transcriptional regulator